MPFYRFICAEDGVEEKRLLSRSKADSFDGVCPKCQKKLVRALGTPQARSLETADEYRNKKVAEGVSQMIDERAHEHFKKHDLPRIIQEQGIEFAKRQGFVDEDGRPK
jgi:predicted DCC family thiol-disulfide oxidoreductase YuxK